MLGPIAASEVWAGEGCATCSQTGCRGRLAVFEYFRLDGGMQRMILDRASAGSLKQAARRGGMKTMLDAGRDAVRAGETTVAEIQRVLLSEESCEDACPRCGREVSPDYANCPFCLHSLREACRSCAAALEEGWRACPSCGTPREDRREAPSCVRCAAPLEPQWPACPFCLQDAP